MITLAAITKTTKNEKENMRYKIYLRYIIIILVSLQATSIAYSQSGIPSNLSNVNVSELSDTQIRQIMAQAQNSGLSDQQLIQQAQGRGMSNDQIQALQKRIEDIRSREGASGGSSGLDTAQQTRRRLNYRPDTASKDQFDINTAFSPKVFGADLFRNKNIKFEPNIKIATPVNYIVGPEDQLLINVYGKSVINWKLEVSPDGNINIPGVGIINVSGKTIEQATAQIKAKLSANNYAVGRGTSVQVSLGNIRSIRVNMVGQLTRPGTYTLPSLVTVFDALYAAGGPNNNGTFRQIAVIRNNRVVRTLDVYDFLTKGEQKGNIGLQDGDIIQVPSYRTRVELAGEIKIPGLFEVLPGESLQDVLNFAGGFSDQAYTARIKVSQISDQQRKLTDVTENDYKSHTPLRGDKYTVERILERYENRLSITGAVFRPGQYELQKGITLSQLIANAAGLKEDAFGRGSITRLNADNTKALIPFNTKVSCQKAVADITLQREDSIHISSLFDLRDKYKVTIKGEVRKPGTFSYADSMTVEDMIIRAGGFSEGASPKRIEVSRRINNSDPSSTSSIVAQVFSVNADAQLTKGEANFRLKPFDIVSVYGLPGYEKQRTIKVEGEVVYPGYYTIQKKNEKDIGHYRACGRPVSLGRCRRGHAEAEQYRDTGGRQKQGRHGTTGERTVEPIEPVEGRVIKTRRRNHSTILRNNYVGIDLKKILEKPGNSIDLLVEDGDEIRVPKQQQIVRVNGEVLYPSAVVYSGNKSFKDYVLNAGGFSPQALKKGAYVVYPNGTVRGTRKFLFFNSHPSVRPGSEIYVPKRPPPSGNTGMQIIGYTTGLASLGAIILGILSINR
jgi:protein involved in polysaccharide export with SLBB domain